MPNYDTPLNVIFMPEGCRKASPLKTIYLPLMSTKTRSLGLA